MTSCRSGAPCASRCATRRRLISTCARPSSGVVPRSARTRSRARCCSPATVGARTCSGRLTTIRSWSDPGCRQLAWPGASRPARSARSAAATSCTPSLRRSWPSAHRRRGRSDRLRRLHPGDRRRRHEAGRGQGRRRRPGAAPAAGADGAHRHGCRASRCGRPCSAWWTRCVPAAARSASEWAVADRCVRRRVWSRRSTSRPGVTSRCARGCASGSRPSRSGWRTTPSRWRLASTGVVRAKAPPAFSGSSSPPESGADWCWTAGWWRGGRATPATSVTSSSSPTARRARAVAAAVWRRSPADRRSSAGRSSSGWSPPEGATGDRTHPARRRSRRRPGRHGSVRSCGWRRRYRGRLGCTSARARGGRDRWGTGDGR